MIRDEALERIATPALILDLDVARRNIAEMAGRIDGLPADLRPHIKAHKSAELARLQVAAGALGVTTATVAEAVAMANAGIEDVFVANQVVSPPAMLRLLDATGETRIRIAVDDADNLAAWGRNAAERRTEIGVLVEVDVGLGRGGVRSLEDAVQLARLAVDTSGVTLDGLYGYEGHCASEPDGAIRAASARQSMEILARAAHACRDAGIPIGIVSAGATGTFEVTGAMPEVTEVQAGSYVLMDHFHEPLVSGFGTALTVMTTVLGRHDDMIVLDTGRKSVDVSLRPLLAPDAAAEVIFVHEEHVGLRFDGKPPYGIGDRLHLVPGYAPTTVNLFGSYHVIEGERVLDVWRILARHGDP